MTKHREVIDPFLLMQRLKLRYREADVLAKRWFANWGHLLNEFLYPDQLRLYRCWHKGAPRLSGTTFYAINRRAAKQRFAAMFCLDMVDIDTAVNCKLVQEM